MMKKRGDGGLSIGVVIGFVFLVFLIVIVSTGVWQKYSFFISIAKLIPGFNYTESTEGMSIVGINLDNKNRLEYFTGEKWKKIDFKTANDAFFLGDYEIKPAEVKNNLSSFYIDIKRKPEILRIEINEWRYWSILMASGEYGEFVLITPWIKSYFEKEVSPAFMEYVYIDYLKNFKFTKSSEVYGIYYPGFAKIDLSSKPDIANKIIEWRDSILQGNKCEKFLGLNVNKDKKGFENKEHTVRKNNQYVFVNLNEPVENKAEKWQNDGCLGVENYNLDSRDLKLWDLKINFFDYDLKMKKTLEFSYSPVNGWKSPDTKYLTGIIGFRKEKEKYSIPQSDSLVDGLYKIFKTGSENDMLNVRIYLPEWGNSDSLIYSKDKFTQNDLASIDEILYNKILSEYNKRMIYLDDKSKGGQNVLSN